MKKIKRKLERRKREKKKNLIRGLEVKEGKRK